MANRDDFRERLDRAVEAYEQLVGSQNSATERYFELGHRGDGTCPRCSESHVRAALDEAGADIIVCKACGYRGPCGQVPLRPSSPWFTHEV